MESGASSLKSRVEALLAEALDERSALEARKVALLDERDERIKALRAEYAEKASAIDEDLATVKRLEAALRPPAPRTPKPTSKPKAESKRYRPRVEYLRAVLQVLSSGPDTVSDIAEAGEINRSTVDTALLFLREDGMVRLTGERPSPNGRTPARTFAITPAGEEFLAMNETVNGAAA